MKNKLILALTLSLITALCLSVFCIGVSAYDAVTWENDRTTVARAGYPRMTSLNDNVLLLTATGYGYRSTDDGLTWTDGVSLGKGLASETVYGGNTFALSKSNYQPLQLPDGRIMLSYRANCDARDTLGLFYSSIRVAYSYDKGLSYTDEEILIEDAIATTVNSTGYWEPFPYLLNNNTVVLYYSDSYNVNENMLGSGGNWEADAKTQNLSCFTYTIGSDTWTTSPLVCISGDEYNARPGMMSVVKLLDGSYACVYESNDLCYRTYNGRYSTCWYCIDISFSQDGYTWTEPKVIAAAPAGYSTSAPFMTILPDGRVVVTYANGAEYVGNVTSSDANKNTVLLAIISNEALSYNNVVAATGMNTISSSFTLMDDPVPETQNAYASWNSVYTHNGYLYTLAGCGVNVTASESSTTGTVISRAAVSSSHATASARALWIPISTAEEFMMLGNKYSYAGMYYLTENINLAGVTGQTPIGTSNVNAFTGKFDGCNYTITGVDIDNTTAGVKTGLFGYVMGGAEISNLTAHGSVSATTEITGGLFGLVASANISNCKSYIDVNVTGNVKWAGGIVARILANGNTIISDCVNYGDVTGYQHVGGIVGMLEDSSVISSATLVDIADCANFGHITSTSTWAGGIAGYMITNTTLSNMVISGCANHGAVDGPQYLGGIVGYAKTVTANKPSVLFCYNNAAITSTATQADIGGIAGVLFNAEVTNTYNAGALAGNKNVGGIVGRTHETAVIANSYNVGALTATSAVRGIAGVIAGVCQPSNCYYLSTLPEDVNATALTAEQLKSSANYAGFDFASGDTWTIDSSAYYPYATLALTNTATCETHTPSDWVVLTEATSTSTGVRVKYCTICGEELSREDIPMILPVAGDADADGELTVGDALVVLKYLNAWRVTINTTLADINADGKIGLGDVLGILIALATQQA